MLKKIVEILEPATWESLSLVRLECGHIVRATGKQKTRCRTCLHNPGKPRSLNGETKSLKMWAAQSPVEYSRFTRRVKRYGLEMAINLPLIESKDSWKFRRKI